VILLEKIKEIIEDSGFDYIEKVRTLYTTCPECGQDDKFSILKENGSCVCYRGSCEFGRQWFEDWIAQTQGISRPDAKKLLHGHKTYVGGDNLVISFTEDEVTPDDIPLEALEWPQYGFNLLEGPDSEDGLNYLQSRGIPLEIAKQYDIRYSSWFRRVVLPIHMGGKNYGWQARAVDKVDAADRMRNNEGFRRDAMIMFMDRVSDCKHMILCEGPFDALKFHNVGGNVATLGKEIADKQVDLINSSGIDTLYIALDDDAAEEMNKLSGRIDSNIKLKLIKVPESAVLRCEQDGNKADFGECTFDECTQAFENAVDFDSDYILIHIK
jgi:hypothetical protein